MAKLLIIADDFAGALEAGTRLAVRGVKAKIAADLEGGLAVGEGDVLVLDAGLHGLSQEEAGALLNRVASKAKKAGLPYIYKKTGPEPAQLKGDWDGEIQFYDTESSLSDKLNLRGKASRHPKLPPSLFVVSGSVDPVMRRQIKEAERYKFKRICLAVRQKLDPAWLASEGCTQAVERWIADARARKRMILDANDEAAEKATRQFAAENSLNEGQVRLRVISALAGVTKGLLDCGLETTLMCVGGDTLKALMATVGAPVLTPLLEIEEKVVLSSLSYRKKTRYIIEEPDGFDKPDLLCRLADQIGA